MQTTSCLQFKRFHVASNQALLGALVAGMLFTLAGAFATETHAQTVTVVPVGKYSTPNTIGFASVDVSVTILITYTGGAAIAPPTGTPTFSLELFDKDFRTDDCDAPPSDVNHNTVGLVGIGLPAPGWVNTGTRGILGGSQVNWTYGWSYAPPGVYFETPCTDGIGGGNPDPFIHTFIGANTVAAPPALPFGTVGMPWPIPVLTPRDNKAAPNLPSVGGADVGVTGRALPANSTVLYGESVAAFSRGDDEISAIGSGAGLYFSTDETQSFPAVVERTAGGVLTLDAEGNTWYEDAYTAPDPVGVVRYLNVNSGPAGASSPTTEMFVVLENSTDVMYTPTSDLDATSLYVDLGPYTTQPVAALAVEDVGVQGVFDDGDLLLFTEEGSSAIQRLAFGGAPEFLNANGFLFDGSTTLNFNHLDELEDGVSYEFEVSPITSLSVASPNGSQLRPLDRAEVDYVAYPLGETTGDTDNDGDVDLNDLNGVRNNFGSFGEPGATPGDAFPFDGIVDLRDLNAVRNNFGVSASNAATSVPEPGSWLLLTIALSGLAAPKNSPRWKAPSKALAGRR